MIYSGLGILIKGRRPEDLTRERILKGEGEKCERKQCGRKKSIVRERNYSMEGEWGFTTGCMEWNGDFERKNGGFCLGVGEGKTDDSGFHFTSPRESF